MEPHQPMWQRLVIVSQKLTCICDLVRGELVYNRARREAWLARTVAWKKSWLYAEPGDAKNRTK